MRWDNLGVDSVAANSPDALPLSMPHAVVRTFDTPGFAGMRFYEIQAKSIISRVPSASRMPFEWTINPYRGCSHACVYCQSGDTPILLANGRTKPLAEIRTGDKIYGTARQGNYRRYTETTVLAHWSTIKPAYRVRLEDGTQLIASGDHRYLTDRGWKYVSGAMSGAGQRPYLTTSNRLLGTGTFADPPKDTDDYRTGYLCGMIRGDGSISTYEYTRPGRGTYMKHSFRLALIDREGLSRTQTYLDGFGVPTKSFLFQKASPRTKAMTALCTQTWNGVASIGAMIAWPTAPTAQWRKGFLAGIFDAEGGHDGCIRISNKDQTIICWIEDCLRHFNFTSVIERRSSGVMYVRLLGGLRERLRFLHTVDPVITRKRRIDGTAIKSAAELGIVSVDPLGLDLPMYDITTGTGDFIANGVVSHNCFARNTHTYLDLDAGHDFDTKVIVKVNAPQLLRKELAAAGWTGAHIAMGTNVDCYQRAEGRYELMRGIIAALRDHANPFSILTKGTLITRDLELLRQAAEVTSVGVSFSVGFVDEAIWRAVEPGTPSPRRRLDAVRTFADAGFDVSVLMAPILPGLTDTEESIDATVAAIGAAGAAGVVPLMLHLRPGAREWYAAWLGRAHPDLVGRYREIYGKGSYAPKAYQREVSARVATAARRHNIGKEHMTEHRRMPTSSPAGTTPRAAPAEQLTLL